MEMDSPKPRSEDWLAVALGGVVIAAVVLLGARPELPTFTWTFSRDPGVDTLARGLADVISPGNLQRTFVQGVVHLVLVALGVAWLRGRVGAFALGFPVVYAIAWLAQVAAGEATVKAWGLEYVIFALVIGLVVRNVIGVPRWLLEAVRTELYIKVGLVLLGASVLFSEIVKAGALGIVQALLVVLVVWSACFWLCRRLRVDDEFAAMLSTAVAICGVSAAIAACGAIRGDGRKLSYVTSLVLVVAVPMMVLMPWAIQAFAIPELVGGAWLGGTLDTSGSVVAAGALVGESAMKVGVIVKFSQNVLLGLAAFLLAVAWSMKENQRAEERPGLAVIWERFPKFVLGFVAVSIVFSFVLAPETVKATKASLDGLRTIWFSLAFASIGLETEVRSLVTMEGGRPAAAFLLAQAINVAWTLLLAYLLFGGLLIPVPELG